MVSCLVKEHQFCFPSSRTSKNSQALDNIEWSLCCFAWFLHSYCQSTTDECLFALQLLMANFVRMFILLFSCLYINAEPNKERFKFNMFVADISPILRRILVVLISTCLNVLQVKVRFSNANDRGLMSIDCSWKSFKQYIFVKGAFVCIDHGYRSYWAVYKSEMPLSDQQAIPINVCTPLAVKFASISHIVQISKGVHPSSWSHLKFALPMAM